MTAESKRLEQAGPKNAGTDLAESADGAEGKVLRLDDPCGQSCPLLHGTQCGQRSFNGEKRPVSASSEETNEDEHPVPLVMLQATCRGTG